MNSELDQSDTPPPGRSRAAIVVGIIVIVAVVAAAVYYLTNSSGGGQPAVAAPTPAPPKSAPVASAPAPTPAPPTTAVDSPRDARPKPKKKADAPAPAPAPTPAAPTAGELHIDADVPGAMVFIDRKFVGNTPVTAKDVAPGRHQLNLSADGYDGYSDSIEVAVGTSDVMVRFKEVRLSETVDVVHKHGVGSCEGRLVADPQGVRYDTTNKNDAFTVRFSEIETFEVNYLEKNLRIKKRGGKLYNFTTKAASADPLFVFHRNVDKVRKQVVGEK
jgi:hypothetical protein